MKESVLSGALVRKQRGVCVIEYLANGWQLFYCMELAGETRDFRCYHGNFVG